jgi:hypothetical protein
MPLSFARALTLLTGVFLASCSHDSNVHSWTSFSSSDAIGTDDSSGLLTQRHNQTSTDTEVERRDFAIFVAPKFPSLESSPPTADEETPSPVCKKFSAALAACTTELRSLERTPSYDQRYISCMKGEYGFESDPPECVH